MASEESLRRGRPNPQHNMLDFVDLGERVPRDHRRRRIKAVADAALTRVSPEFDRMKCARAGARNQASVASRK